MEDWKIHKNGSACTTCGTGFPEGETFFSAIFATQDSFERRDCCQMCWTRAREGDERTDDPFSFWKTRMPVDGEPPRIPYQRAEDFFWKLVDTRKRNEKPSRLVFPLALLLMRKKVLTLQGSSRKRGKDVLHFVDRENDRSLDVVDPGLESEDLDGLEQEIRDLLFPQRIAAERDGAET